MTRVFQLWDQIETWNFHEDIKGIDIDDDDNEEEDNNMEDDNNKGKIESKGISVLGLDRDLEFL